VVTFTLVQNIKTDCWIHLSRNEKEWISSLLFLHKKFEIITVVLLSILAFCDAILCSYKWFPTFWRIVVSSPSEVKHKKHTILLAIFNPWIWWDCNSSKRQTALTQHHNITSKKFSLFSVSYLQNHHDFQKLHCTLKYAINFSKTLLETRSAPAS
jgi:hypothetical protein